MAMKERQKYESENINMRLGNLLKQEEQKKKEDFEKTMSSAQPTQNSEVTNKD